MLSKITTSLKSPYQFTKFSLLILLFFVYSSVNATDINKGIKAYKAKDYKTALQAFEALANQGVAEAQYKLGNMYHEGSGVSLDYKKAFKLYMLAAEQSYSEAQFELGVMYYEGQGVPQNYKRMIKWYTLAAKQGVSEAQFDLGIMYNRGKGVAQDSNRAVKWITMAADQGHRLAQLKLTVMYGKGEQGIPQDYIRAHMWANIMDASHIRLNSRNIPSSRDLLALKMTPEQIEQAQEKASDWFDKHNN